MNLNTALRRFFGVLLLGAFSLAHSQGFPEAGRPIRLIVPFGAGASADAVARAFARAMSEQTGATVIVDNKPGADAVIGVEYVKQAAPDGYTLLFGNLSTQVLNVFMVPNLRYNPLTDFIPVAATNKVSLVINAGPSTNFKSLHDLVAAARANPGKYSYGSGSTSTRLGMQMFAYLTKLDLLSVSYKTQAQAAADLAGGQVDLLVTDVTTSAPFYKSGKFRALATTGRDRLSALPNVPTVREQGVEDYEFTAWHAIFAPAGTPEAVVGKLWAMIGNAAKSKYVTDALASNASDPMEMDTAHLRVQLKSDIEKWGRVLEGMKEKTRAQKP
ncbi:tripartite tricarboxylate transporter substrate binding protein [Variovorax paradoxus]|nr:tripartite tricarboxylate transporter substrate binding protein [Variovorax paradoxus]MBT2304674.1 tripartite tricarboxylate transporter substrate binding protein [Variovorax paradoxus]